MKYILARKIIILYNLLCGKDTSFGLYLQKKEEKNRKIAKKIVYLHPETHQKFQNRQDLCIK